MFENFKNKQALDILCGTLKDNPDLWDTRKKTAQLLYEDGHHAEAADILWSAPEIPSTDVDVAFTLQIIARVKPNRAIRLIYEVLRRNKGKAAKNMAVANALNKVGLYMEAARFYGAAVAADADHFDVAFERQMLWMDDSKKIIQEWRQSDQLAQLPLDVPNEDLSGGMIRPTSIHNHILAIAEGVENPNAESRPEFAKPIPTQPLVAPGASSIGFLNPSDSAPVPPIEQAGNVAASQEAVNSQVAKSRMYAEPGANQSPVSNVQPEPTPTAPIQSQQNPFATQQPPAQSASAQLSASRPTLHVGSHQPATANGGYDNSPVKKESDNILVTGNTSAVREQSRGVIQATGGSAYSHNPVVNEQPVSIQHEPVQNQVPPTSSAQPVPTQALKPITTPPDGSLANLVLPANRNATGQPARRLFIPGQ